MLRRIFKRYRLQIFSGAMLLFFIVNSAFEASWINGVNVGLWGGVFVQRLPEVED